MNRKGRKNSVVKMAFFGLAASLVFSQCSQKSPEASDETINEDATSIRVLSVGGGESHDFDTWFMGTDSKTLEKEGFASVDYIDDMDSIMHYLPDTDVLYLTNNQP